MSTESNYKLFFWKQLRRLLGKVLYEKLRARRYLGYVPNFKNPRTFNEKISYIKLFKALPIAPILADKYEVRAFVEKTIGSSYLVKLYEYGDDPDKIGFDQLPNKFVIKTTHGSGGIFLVEDKSKEDLAALKQNLKKALKTRLGLITNEWWYSQIQPRFVIEEYLSDGKNQVPPDYKFFCFHGKCHYVQVDFDRFIHHTRSFYDRDWNLQPFGVIYPRGPSMEKPAVFAEMLKIADTLATGFDFVRVDLYDINGTIKFGEMTFAPEGAAGRFTSFQDDLNMGSLLKLSL